MDELDRLFHRVVRAVRDARPENLSRPLEVGELLDLVPYRAVRSDVGVMTNDDFAHTVTRLLAGERGYLFVDDLMQDDLKTELASPNPNLTAYRSYVNARVTLSQEHTRRLLESMSTTPDSSIGPSAELAPEPAAPPESPAPATPARVPAATSAKPLSATPAGFSSALRGEGPTGPRREAPTGPRREAPTGPRREAPTGPRAPHTLSSPRPLDPHAEAPHREARPGCKYCGQALPDGREVRYCPACGQNLLVRRCAACSAELEPAWKFCVACGRAAAP
ncbi:MAG TPA: zinc ribbon domain-containing protein [Gemmatimonadaceae bacterium]|nr:zinc ribbon domain-containing protein [Gemmatimonadaceae bacterium]